MLGPDLFVAQQQMSPIYIRVIHLLLLGQFGTETVLLELEKRIQHLAKGKGIIVSPQM